MESEPGVINPLDSIWALLRMSPAFLLRDAHHAMHDIFFCTFLQVYIPHESDITIVSK